MTPAQVGEVWASLDRERLASIARRGPPPIFATISGAHLYGFASPDSDIDLRGAFLLSLREVIGLRPPKETLAIEDKSELDLDWVAHDLRKFVRMLTEHNGYVLEQLYSPLVVIGTPVFDELRELARGCVTRPTVRHYLGFARGRRKRIHEPNPTVKHLLYAYRVLMSGVHLMRHGEVEANLHALNKAFCNGAVDELIGRKREGAEKMPLEAREIDVHEKQLDALEAMLHEAHAASTLPEEPQGVGALEDLVVRTRLATVKHSEC